jgi:tetratricopeptide (TPR) repeat protein
MTNGNFDHLFESNRSASDQCLLVELGDCHTAVGHFDQARQYYEKAAAIAPDDPGPYVGLGMLALQRDCLEDAEVAFRVACRLDPACSKAYAGLAAVAHQKCDYKRAFDMYLKCLELDTDNLTALLGLFQTSCRMGSFRKVTHYLEVYLNTHPADTSVMFSLAALYIKDHRLDDAASILGSLLKLDPQNSEAAALLEEVEHTLGRMAAGGEPC